MNWKPQCVPAKISDSVKSSATCSSINMELVNKHGLLIKTVITVFKCVPWMVSGGPLVREQDYAQVKPLEGLTHYIDDDLNFYKIVV